ncbi:MAG: glycosyltransferase family 39 protein [Ignavibacteriaceae bacterium]|nr:glycosyltransferase family 39 protein [Ignavibacteriaceae bacterium]
MENEKIPQNLLTLIISIAFINLLIYLITQAFFAYGMFRDEFYYLACANRLDFGYVDHPPFSIWILAMWKSLFGDSMFAIRIVPAIVTSINLFVIGLFTIRLGGNKTAIIISTIGFMLTPIFMGMNTIYSMNVFDFFFWISSAYIFLRIIQTNDHKLWLLLGVVIGFGLLNKTSMLWLSSGIALGIIFTPLRKELRTKYPYIAAAIALLIFSPYIIWNISHDFAHLEFMRNAASRKYVGLTPVSFIIDQILILNPLSILIWLPGLIFYFLKKESKQFRVVGFIWLTTFAILFINWHSKGEYVAAAYQILFAGGAVMIEKWSLNKSWIKYATAFPVILFGILFAPFARPLLSVENFLDYQNSIGLKPPSSEGHETVLPQFYSDMFGWEDLAKNVSDVYLKLSEEEKKHTLVYCSNYGKAGSLEYYSKKHLLPKVVCPHNNYWYRWPDLKNITTLIIIGGEIEEHLESLEEVYEAGYHQTKYAMPYENNLPIFIGRGFKRSLDEIRQSDKIFI